MRGIGIANVNTGASGTSINGIDPDVFTAMPKAQQLAEWAATELYAPLFFILEGRNFDPSKELKDMTKESMTVWALPSVTPWHPPRERPSARGLGALPRVQCSATLAV